MIQANEVTQRSTSAAVPATLAGESPRTVKRGQKLQLGVGIIDWLSFTLPVPEGQSPADLACWVLGKLPQGATLMDRGHHGYDEGWRLPGGGLVLYHSRRRDMGVHVSLSAGCLALLEGEPNGVIPWVLVEGGHFTRLDIALDTDQVTMEQVQTAIKRGDIVTRCAQVDFVETNRRADGGWEYGGSIVRIGSRSSRRYTRIYDKAAEQGVEDGSIWTRCEVEFKGDHAQLAALHIAEGADLRSLIYSSVDFRDRAADSNTSRCPQLDWWAAWIGSVDRLSFSIKQTIEDVVERATEWVKRQCAPTLAFLDKIKGHDPTWLYNLVDSNMHRISPQRQALLIATG